MGQCLYIHIGMPKTGTTSLQFFLSRNKAKLKQHGIYYPATKRDPFPTATQHRYVNEFMRQQKRNADKGGRISGHVINRVAQEIERQGFAKNVISEELFSYDPEFSAPYLARFRERIDTKVVVFVRRQDTWAESMYAQSVRGGYKADFKSFLQARATSERLDLKEFLDIWAAHFETGNVIVRPYIDRKTQSHHEMLQILGAPPLDSTVAEKRNPSLTGEAMEFIRGFDGLSKTNYPKFNRLFAENLAGITQKGSPTFFEPQERQDFLAGFEKSNQAVAQAYLGSDAPLFDIDPGSFPSAENLTRPLPRERRIELLRQLCDGEDGAAGPAQAIDGSTRKQLSALEALIDDLCTQSDVPV